MLASQTGDSNRAGDLSVIESNGERKKFEGTNGMNKDKGEWRVTVQGLSVSLYLNVSDWRCESQPQSVKGIHTFYDWQPTSIKILLQYTKQAYKLHLLRLVVHYSSLY